MPTAPEPDIKAEAVRKRVEMCPLKGRVGGPAESVCPPDTVRLLGVDAILEHGLKLAQRIFSVLPGLPDTTLCEPADLLSELIVRYANAARRYRWMHWLDDSVKSEWTKFVFFRMVGRERMGVMFGIATDELKKAKTDPVDPASFANMGAGDGTPDPEQAYQSVVDENPHLMTLAIADCAGKGVFGAFGDRATDVYLAVYRGTKNESDRTIATNCGVPQDFVALMRDQSQLARLIRQNCHPQTWRQIEDSVDRNHDRAQFSVPSSLDSRPGTDFPMPKRVTDDGEGATPLEH